MRDPERRREAHLEFPLLCEGPGLVLSTSGLGGPVSSLLLEEGPTPQGPVTTGDAEFRSVPGEWKGDGAVI